MPSFIDVRHQILEVNTEGVDYYVGDMHGHYEKFERLLVAIGFDKERDRMISVGDLIDRGPMSLKCLELLREKWFFSVMANHEEMMWHAYLDDSDPRYNWRLAQSWIPNGGQWGLDFWAQHAGGQLIDEDAYQMSQLALLVGELPHVISVKQPDDSFIHVVHAELPGIHVTDEMILDQVELQKIFNKSLDNHQHTYGFMWSRNRFSPFYKQALSGAPLKEAMERFRFAKVGSTQSPIISGHTIVRKPMIIDNFMNLDTGAYLDVDDYGLTCFNSKTAELLTIHRDRISRDVQPHMIISSLPE